MLRSIYCGIKLTGSQITLQETKKIINGISSTGKNENEVQMIQNMFEAWKFILDTLDEPITIDYLCKINSKVNGQNAEEQERILDEGDLSCTFKKDSIEKLHSILQEECSITEKVIRYFLWGSCSSIFIDGNKRTSLICANKILMMNGKGLLLIPEKYIEKFNGFLTEYITHRRYDKISNFLYEYCLFENKIVKENLNEEEF